MIRLLCLLALLVLLLGQSCIFETDIRTCAYCTPAFNVPLAFKLKKGTDSAYFAEFDFNQPFRKINNLDSMLKLQSQGYKIDTLYYSYNFQPQIHFTYNVDENIALFKLYFPEGYCKKITTDCIDRKSMYEPCCR